jgi:hypothetical protein
MNRFFYASHSEVQASLYSNVIGVNNALCPQCVGSARTSWFQSWANATGETFFIHDPNQLHVFSPR